MPTITEEEAQHVDLERPVLRCDDEIDPGRKQLDPPLPNVTHTMMIVGRPGSGKSSFVWGALCNRKKVYNKLFRRVHWIAPPTSRASFAGGVLKKHPRVYDDITYDVLEDLRASAEEVAERGKGHFSLAVMDDVGASLKNPDLAQALRAMCWNRRHLRLSCWFCVQTYRSLHVDLRRCSSHLLLWKSVNTLESDLVYNELLAVFLRKDEWEAVQKHVYKPHKPHDYIYVDLMAQEIYRVSDEKFYRLNITS